MVKKTVFAVSNRSKKMSSLNKGSRCVIILMLVTTIFFLGSLVTHRDFWVEDEARYAEVLREMVVDNQWIVPHLNGTYYADKPPLYFWLAALFSSVTGSITPLPFLMINWLSALGLVLTTYFFGRYLFNSLAGFTGALILMSSMLFVISAQVVRMDMLFSLFITLAMFSFFRGYKERKGGFYFLCYFFSALAVLTKGPFGFIFVFIPAAGFLVLKKITNPGQHLDPLQRPEYKSDPSNKSFCGGPQGAVFSKRAPWAAGGKLMRVFFLNPGLLLFFLMVFGWLFLAAITGHTDFVKDIFSKQILSRAVDSFQHKEPFYYYLLALPPVFLPWFPFLPWAVKKRMAFATCKPLRGSPQKGYLKKVCFLNQLLQRINKRDYLQRQGDSFTLLYLWFTLGFIVLSVVSCKLFIYLLPLLPPLALFLGHFLAEQMRHVDVPGKSFITEGILAALFSFGILAIIPIAASYISFPFAGLFSGLLLAGILLTLLKKFKELLVLLFSGMGIFSLIGVMIFAPQLNDNFSPRSMGEKIRHYTAKDFRVASFRVTRGILSFYSGQRIAELSRNELPGFFNSSEKKILIIKARDLKKLRKKFLLFKEQAEVLNSYKLNNEGYVFVTPNRVNPKKEKGGPGP